MSESSTPNGRAPAAPLTVIVPEWYLVIGPSVIGGAHVPEADGSLLAAPQPGSPA